MKLTLKDKEFLERLRVLCQSKDLTVELKDDGIKRMVLRKNYGDKVEQEFGQTRQGVRWRFNRLLNNLYSEAYESIYLIESIFGTELRPKAMEIAKQRVELRKQAQKSGQIDIHRLKKVESKRSPRHSEK